MYSFLYNLKAYQPLSLCVKTHPVIAANSRNTEDRFQSLEFLKKYLNDRSADRQRATKYYKTGQTDNPHQSSDIFEEARSMKRCIPPGNYRSSFWIRLHLSEVARLLEKKPDIKVSISDITMRNSMLTGTYPNQYPEILLNILTDLMVEDASVERYGKQVIIQRKAIK